MTLTPQASGHTLEEPTEPLADGSASRSAYQAALAGTIPTRVEQDSLGTMPVPADAYWGIHTARALGNFPITRRARSGIGGRTAQPVVQGGMAHLLAVPLLATPAAPLRIDDAVAAAATAWIVCHEKLLGLSRPR